MWTLNKGKLFSLIGSVTDLMWCLNSQWAHRNALGSSSALVIAVQVGRWDTLGNALAMWPRYVLFDLRWKLDIFHLPIPSSDFSLCKYSNFHLSCHPWNGVNKIYYQYNQRQDLLIGHRPIHCTLIVLLSITSVRNRPVLQVLAAVPVPPWSSLPRSAHSSGDQGIHRVSCTHIVPRVTAFAQQFSSFQRTSKHSISSELPNSLMFGKTRDSIFPFYRWERWKPREVTWHAKITERLSDHPEKTVSKCRKFLFWSVYGL